MSSQNSFTYPIEVQLVTVPVLSYGTTTIELGDSVDYMCKQIAPDEDSIAQTNSAVRNVKVIANFLILLAERVNRANGAPDMVSIAGLKQFLPYYLAYLPQALGSQLETINRLLPEAKILATPSNSTSVNHNS